MGRAKGQLLQGGHRNLAGLHSFIQGLEITAKRKKIIISTFLFLGDFQKRWFQTADLFYHFESTVLFTDCSYSSWSMILPFQGVLQILG